MSIQEVINSLLSAAAASPNGVNTPVEFWDVTSVEGVTLEIDPNRNNGEAAVVLYSY